MTGGCYRNEICTYKTSTHPKTVIRISIITWVVCLVQPSSHVMQERIGDSEKKT